MLSGLAGKSRDTNKDTSPHLRKELLIRDTRSQFINAQAEYKTKDFPGELAKI